MIGVFRKSALRMLQAAALFIVSCAVVSLDMIPGVFPASMQSLASGGMVFGICVGLVALGFLVQARFRSENSDRSQ